MHMSTGPRPSTTSHPQDCRLDGKSPHAGFGYGVSSSSSKVRARRSTLDLSPFHVDRDAALLAAHWRSS
eukprot:129134-Pleurochrysis_carterae.AAC.1